MSLLTVSRTFTPLFVQNTQLPHTGDTIDTSVKTYTLPGNIMGPNGALLIMALWSVDVQSGTTKTFTIKFGSTTVQSASFTGGSSTLERWLVIMNRNSVSSQVCIPASSYNAGSNTSSQAVVTAAENTDTNVTIDFRVTVGVNTRTVALESAQIYLLR